MPESTTMSGITHELISEVFLTLLPVAKTFLSGTEGLNESHKITTGQLIRFLEEYDPRLKFDVKVPLDFSKPDEELADIAEFIEKSKDLNLKSINIIDRVDGKITSIIVVNTNTPPKWHRFCYIKESCHVLIGLNEHLIGPNLKYALDNSLLHIRRTATANEQAPFSIFDFDVPEYPASQKIENAAEILACLILVPIKYILEERFNYRELTRSHPFANSQSFAEKFHIPEHYARLLVGEYSTSFIEQHVTKLLDTGNLAPGEIDPRYWSDEIQAVADEVTRLQQELGKSENDTESLIATYQKNQINIEFGDASVDRYPSIQTNKQSIIQRIRSDLMDKNIREE